MSNPETDTPQTSEQLPSLKHSLDPTVVDDITPENEEEKARKQFKKLDISSVARALFHNKVYKLDMKQFLAETEPHLNTVDKCFDHPPQIKNRCELALRMFGFCKHNNDLPGDVFANDACFVITEDKPPATCKLYRYYSDGSLILVSSFKWGEYNFPLVYLITFFISKYLTVLK